MDKSTITNHINNSTNTNHISNSTISNHITENKNNIATKQTNI